MNHCQRHPDPEKERLNEINYRLRCNLLPPLTWKDLKALEYMREERRPEVILLASKILTYLDKTDKLDL